MSRRRLGLILLVAAIAALGWQYRPQSPPAPPVPAESTLRMPASNPPVEPGRPDLLAEPRPPEAAQNDD